MKKDLMEIIQHYGVNNQLRKFNEECYELIEAIIDYKYVEVYKESPAEKYHKGHLIEELSDVTVMLKQFQAYYGITDEEIEEVMKYKILRQKDRISKGE